MVALFIFGIYADFFLTIFKIVFHDKQNDSRSKLDH